MTRSSDAVVEAACSDIMDILRAFDSPKDAGSALGLAHYEFLIATYPQEDRAAAIDSVESSAKLLIELLKEGWQ